jgi:hypothetical protein
LPDFLYKDDSAEWLGGFMGKHLPFRELVVAAILFAINALAVSYLLGVPASLAVSPFEYETDVQDGCENGIDDDEDGRIDCADEDCIGISPCIAPAPALGPAGLLIGAVALLLIGTAAVKVRRREDH